MQSITRLINSNVTILGLGLMGGSLAMALRPFCKSLAVYDTETDILFLAQQNMLADCITGDLSEALREADIIILAAPVKSILALIRDIPHFHQGPAVIFDIGSTKVELCQAMDELPARYDPLGGHPMTGKASSGLANASGGLFAGSIFALSPCSHTTQKSRDIGLEIVAAVGALPFWINPDMHDRIVALTSHMPYILSLALVLSTPDEFQPLIGPGFLSSTRLAGSSPRMMFDILISNRMNVLSNLDVIIQQLGQIKNILDAGDEDQIIKLTNDGRLRYNTLSMADPKKG